MTTEERQKLRRDLKQFYGAMKEVGERSEVSSQYVYMVLSGQRNNSKVLVEAAKVLAEHEEQEAGWRIERKEAMRKASAYATA